ncbi:MAG: riboflavin biosynthesis protein RibF [Verrucomicrobiales bacterium]|nr:riboflavin biosynthesis protein RibF [Verrucomicrobiales bacterium]
MKALKVLHEAEPLGDPPAAVHVAVGVFDGVHLGHAVVVGRMVAEARSRGGVPVVVTFDRHPQTVVAPAHAPAMIYPLWRRLRALEGLGLESALVYRFDAEFSRQTGEAFIDRLRRGFRSLAGITVGAGFVFGRERSGDLDLLRRLGPRHGFTVNGVPPLEMEGGVISSTRLRESIAEGRLDEAARMLGRPYSLAGEVREGDRLGRQLGFPTANLEVTGLVLPPTGVYAAWAKWDGAVRAAAVNLGTRPTVDPSAAGVRVEAHLLDFDGDLYGRQVELELGPRLRGECRFPSRDALVEQITRDVAGVRQWAGNKGLP